MAWLLHEPRLLAKVPVFCILSINPLVKNTSAPLSVSVGAVRLLTHLHARLEVYFDPYSSFCFHAKVVGFDQR